MAQPPPSNITLRGLLSLPYRLCNPPPAIGKVRSCGVTPVLDVRLDDVLSRRHLPPIGLKDLEEYLLYVEHAPENLYFTLWLKDYTARYHAWVQREKQALMNKKEKMAPKSQRQNFPVPPTPDPSLAMFYLRAKQTFFTPNGEYELNIPSDILTPFHSAPHAPHTHPHDHSRPSLWHSQSVHPDPAVFAEVAIEARNMLEESLKRFVRAASTNVGSQRAVCGIVAGCVFTFFAGILPLVLTTGRWNVGPHGLLIRLVALPGLWFGFTVLIASLQGICLMIYVFGDLRQLRKFELARPTISRPIPMPISSPLPSGSQSLFVPSRRAPPVPERSTGTVRTISSSLDSPISFVSPTPPHPESSSECLSSCGSCESEASGSARGIEIDVSPAFFDDVPAPEGPATASCLHRPQYRLPPPSLSYLEPVHIRQEPRPSRLGTRPSATSSPIAVDLAQSTRSVRSSTKSSPEYGPTAGFIPNGYTNNSTSSLNETMRSMRSQRSACYFDFDTLPPSRAGIRRDSASATGADGTLSRTGLQYVNASGQLTSTVVMEPPSPRSGSFAPASSSATLGAIGHYVGRTQYKCNKRPSAWGADESLRSPSCDKSTFSIESTVEERWRFQLAMLIPSFTAGVPAFATPLTLVQSPVVKRAQWEVVMRAACVAAVIAGSLTGILVGVVH